MVVAAKGNLATHIRDVETQTELALALAYVEIVLIVSRQVGRKG